MYRLQGRTVDTSLRPVVALHGWPGNDTAATHLSGLLATGFPPGTRALDAIVATGRTVYLAFAGTNWGTESTIYPTGTGGTGTTCIDDAITQATDDGLDASAIDLLGVSMGALNALNWAWRNPTKVHRLWGAIPAFNLSAMYDGDAFLAASMRQVHGGANKTAWLPLSLAYDPYRQTSSVATIASKVALYADRDDTIVPFTTLTTWCSTLGIPLTASTAPGVTGGGHAGAFTQANWDDLLPLQHFEAP